MFLAENGVYFNYKDVKILPHYRTIQYYGTTYVIGLKPSGYRSTLSDSGYGTTSYRMCYRSGRNYRTDMMAFLPQGANGVAVCQHDGDYRA